MRLTFILLTLAVISCDASLDQQLTELVVSKDKWVQAVGLQTYSYDATKYCYCSDSGKTVRIMTTDERTSDVDPFYEDVFSIPFEVSSMRDRFQQILRMLELQNEGEGSLTVLYDEKLGYPSEIKWKGPGSHGVLRVVIENVNIESNSGI